MNSANLIRTLILCPCLFGACVATDGIVEAQPAKTTQQNGAPVPRPGTPTIEQFMKIRAPGSPTLATDGTLYVRDWPDGINQLYKRPSPSPTAPMIRMTNFPDG